MLSRGLIQQGNLSGLARFLPSIAGASLRGLSSEDSDMHLGFGDFGLTNEQQELKRLASDFAREELVPHGSLWDQESQFPVETLRKAASLGFAGVYVTEEYGGCGLSRSDGVALFEALSYGDVPTTAYLTIHNMVAYVLDRFGTADQRARYLPDLCRMERFASYCLTEPDSGSDAASLSTRAVKVGDHYELSGTKAFISGAPVSDMYLVMARTGGKGSAGITAFLVDKALPGVSFGQPEEKLGWRCQPTASVIFDQVKVPQENRLGKEGEGFKIAMAALDGGRINIGACSVGGAQFCVDYVRRYVQERRQFGHPLISFQATQFKLADMLTSLQAARLMVRHAAHSMDMKSPSMTLDAAMAKRFATDTCYDITNTALQLLGGYGYLKDYPIERYMRDLRVHSILEGTNEIMRMITCRELQRRFPLEAN